MARWAAADPRLGATVFAFGAVRRPGPTARSSDHCRWPRRRLQSSGWTPGSSSPSSSRWWRRRCWPCWCTGGAGQARAGAGRAGAEQGRPLESPAPADAAPTGPDLQRSPAPGAASKPVRTAPAGSRRSAPRRSAGRRIRTRRSGAGRPGSGAGAAVRAGRPGRTDPRPPVVRPPGRGDPARGRTRVEPHRHARPEDAPPPVLPMNGGGGRHPAEAEQDCLSSARSATRAGWCGSRAEPDARPRSDPSPPGHARSSRRRAQAALPHRRAGRAAGPRRCCSRIGASHPRRGAAAPVVSERRTAASGRRRGRREMPGSGLFTEAPVAIPRPAGRRSRRRRRTTSREPLADRRLGRRNH